MNIGVREAIYICLECLVFAFLILIISLFSGYAKDSLHLKADLNTQMTEISEYRDIYEFTMGCELNTSDINDYLGRTNRIEIIDYTMDELSEFFKLNINKRKNNESNFFSIGKEWSFAETEVSGEDLIRFIGKFPNEYNIIIFSVTSTELKLNKLRKEASSEEWSMSYNMELLGDSEIKDFYCFGVYDDLKSRYDTIVFVEKAYTDNLVEQYYRNEYSSCKDGNYRDSWNGYLN